MEGCSMSFERLTDSGPKGGRSRPLFAKQKPRSSWERQGASATCERNWRLEGAEYEMAWAID